jgi:hypothetical protein
MLNMRSPLDGVRSPFGPRRGGADPDAVISALFANGEVGAWYDPSDISTLWKDTAGTDPVTAATDPVARIDDKSGNGKHLTQGTFAQRPLYQLDGARPYLAFDGTDDGMVTSAIDFTGTDKMSIFIGQRSAGGTASIILEHSSNSSSNAGTFYITAPEDATIEYGSMGRGNSASAAALRAAYSTATFPDLSVLTATHDIAGDLSVIRRNGVSGTNATGDKGTGNFGNFAMYVGRRGGASLPWTGRLYPMIVLGRAVTAGEITAVEAWVNSKTGAY